MTIREIAELAVETSAVILISVSLGMIAIILLLATGNLP